MAIWRFKVSPRQGEDDPRGRRVLATLRDFGIENAETVTSSRLYLVELPEDESTAHRIGSSLLSDPLVESCEISKVVSSSSADESRAVFEVYFKPGVMDTVAESTMLAIGDMGIEAGSVRTGFQYVVSPRPTEAQMGRIQRLIANDCVEDVVIGERPIGPPPVPPKHDFSLRTVPIRDLDSAGLARLSRDGHLFLSSAEMTAIQNYFQSLGRDPTDLELETLAQTWSEHCVHKTLKSAYVYRGAPMPGMADGNGDVELRFSNLLADTIARATRELMDEGRGPECLSVFVDNAGIIGFDDQYGVAFKVETHNHPSAIEPYGGAATGVGGVIRDILGCGLGARPVANTDVFCVAPSDWPVDQVPKGVIHPKTVLKGIVSGVRDYGNCMGIPTVNGAVHFDPRYLGNPLVYCGCVGMIPRDRIEKAARPGDAIVVLGGRTGRDGIHGATFSSAELTDTHEDEFSHAVQIGNPVEEKKVRDVVLLARDYRAGGGAARCLFSAITDCGAGGLSSAIGEMGEKTGVEVDLEKIPLKYAGLRYDEIWISEAQERMVLSVPPENIDTLLALAEREDVEATVIGKFTDNGRLVARYDGTVVGDLEMAFLHDGLPKIERVAEWQPAENPDSSGKRVDSSPPTEGRRCAAAEHYAAQLHDALSDPNVASKHWVIRQYDHEVQSGSVVKPLVGKGEGPGDAAVVRPRLDSRRGVVVGCGLSLEVGDVDPYWMAIASIDEAVRNCVSVGGDPSNMAILDNFCWPSSEDPHALGALVRTCQACYDAAKAYGLPFISGKDSLNNVFAMNADDAERVRKIIDERYSKQSDAIAQQFNRQPNKLGIPYTLLISAISVIEDVDKCITSAPTLDEGEAALAMYVGLNYPSWDDVNLSELAELHRVIHSAVNDRLIRAAHDVSDGGVLAALAEMAIGAGCSLELGNVVSDHLMADEAAPQFGYIVVPNSDAMNAEGLVSRFASIASGFENGCVEVLARLVMPFGDSQHAAMFRSSAMAEPSAKSSVDQKLNSASKRGLTLESVRSMWRAPLDW